MSHFSLVRWLQAIERRFRRAPRKRPSSAGLRPARLVPRLEVLEDRTVSSTLTVTSAADSPLRSVVRLFIDVSPLSQECFSH